MELMGLLEELLQPRTAYRSGVTVNDERFWTSSVGGRASSGINVTPETALTSSAVWACVRMISESIATMPVIVYRRRSDGGKERAPSHPLYSVLHDAPNGIQTAFAWKRVMMVHALLYGGGFSLIVPGPRGAVDTLQLIHPNNVDIESIPDGGIRYLVRGEDGIKRPVNAEDIFHLPGLSLDGTNGLSLVAYARESIGLALAAEHYSGTFYANGAEPSGILKHPGALSPQAAQNVKASWHAQHGGLEHAHEIAVLEEGMEWQSTGMTHADAELIEQLDWSAADIARFFNVPLHMIQLMTKTTSWGSGIEEMGIEFVVFSLMPWIKNWEQTIAKQLILAPQAYFCEFLVDSLMRGKLQDRYTAYGTGRQWGWLSANDVRRLENMNPIPNGDQYFRPLNMVDVNATQEQATQQSATIGQMQGHYQLLLHEAATRVIRKEIVVMTKTAKRCASDADAWRAAVEEFYVDHATFVAETMRIGRREAERYAQEQVADLVENGVSAMADWETRRAGDLIALAMGGQDA
jgi:HK97 family phage portal protein